MRATVGAAGFSTTACKWDALLGCLVELANGHEGAAGWIPLYQELLQEGLTGVDGSDAGAIIRYSDGAATPSVIEPEVGEAARPLARQERGQEQVQREERGEIETGPLRRRIDDFAG